MALGDRDSAPAHGIVLLDADSEPGPDSSPQDRAVTAPSRRPQVAVAAAAVVATLWLVLSGSDRPPPDPPPANAERPSSPEPSAVDPAEGSGSAAARLTIAVTSSRGEPGRLLWWGPDDGAIHVEEALELRNVAFDRSGTWVAGIGLATASGGGTVLWAGPVGRALEPVEVGVRGFAWHDSRPGHLAWTVPAPGGGSSLITVNLGSTGPHRRARTIDSEDRLGHWGDWGYAFTSRTRTPRTTVLDPTGAVLADQREGQAVGWIPGAGVVVSGAPGALPLEVLDPSGRWVPVGWAGEDERAVAVAVAPDGRWAAVHLVRDGAPEGRIALLVDGVPRAELTDVPGWAAMTWSPDGHTLAIASQPDERTPASLRLWDRRTGVESAVAMPVEVRAQDRIGAMAYPPGPRGA